MAKKSSFNQEQFEKEIQHLLDTHHFAGESRRQIFLQIMQTALAAKKDEADKTDKTSLQRNVEVLETEE